MANLGDVAPNGANRIFVALGYKYVAPLEQKTVRMRCTTWGKLRIT